MAKDNKKAGKRERLPKRVAGLKVPKALRKQKGVAALLRHPLAAEVALAA
ncbi:MAG: hypothetical protein H7X93_01995, partial [Sphingomonadaceae bacterium]|nr:hypothetical protein [Sphingomonadaceae bacterium]